MKLTPEYIFNHLNEYYTNTYEYIKDYRTAGKIIQHSTWNHVHGGWELGKTHLIKKDVYAIMPYFDSNGKISCNKVIKGFITEWYPCENNNNIIFTSADIAGPYNKYIGKYVTLKSLDKLVGIYTADCLKYFMMFDDIKEAKAALKSIVKDNEKTTIENQLKVLDKEINDLQYELNRKLEVKENLTKKLNSI